MTVVMWCRIGKVTVTRVGSGEYEMQDVRCLVHQQLCV